MDTIQLTEMGARSKYDRGNNRTVRSIVNGSTSAAKFSRLYQRIIEYTKSKHIVELGTSLGINTCYLALRPNSKVYSLEGCPNLLQLAKENIATIGLDNIELLLGNIDTTLPSLLARVPSLDFVFFDANHRYEPTLAYFELCLNYRHEHSIFIFDDIHWSEGMEKAWAKIKARPEVSMTIDLYRSGIVLFNEGQTAQHHIISF